MEKRILKQRSKIDWLNVGDGNNSYFHTSLKEKHRQTQMHTLENDNGIVLPIKVILMRRFLTSTEILWELLQIAFKAYILLL